MSRTSSAFTVVEMIVVVVVIGILAAIAIPRCVGARDDSADRLVFFIDAN